MITSAARVLVVVTAAGLFARAQDVGLATILERAAQYATTYGERFAGLVAEERYVQETKRAPIPSGGNLSRNNPGGGFVSPGGRDDRRVLRSDYLLVQLERGSGWMPFRDVFEVDGKKVRDREDRLAKLFLQPSASSFEQANRIMQDSTRHNLGSVTRTINIPILAILFLAPELASHFHFDLETRESVGGRDTVRIAYRETARPSLIRTRRAGQLVTDDADLPAEGKFWIDPADGTVVKTSLVASDVYVSSQITVTFREEPDLKVWVPAQMEERYLSRGNGEDILGTATYSNYRRFKVTTDEAIKKPGL